MIGYFVIASVIQVFLLTGFTNGQNYEDRVDVEVYYEALSPFARHFMINQLSPFLKGDLSPYINLTLIPYGKAVTYQRNDSNYEFTCHHGEAECYANKLHACAIVLLNDGLNTQGLGFNKEAVEFIVCLMKDLTARFSINEIETAFEKCKVTAQHDGIKTCANGMLGAKVLARMGNLTNHFQNPLGNVPTIIFNGVFRKRVSDQSERNFKEQFCSKMESRNLPACQESEVSSPTTPIPYQEKVDVEVYYETLDPYSKRFMVKQLNPFLQGDLSTYINLTLIPYGKAQTFERNISDYGFTCHHGEAECYGNKLQVCAMALFNNGLSTPGLGFNKEAVEFVICLMKDLYATSSITEIDTAFEKCKVTAQYDDIRSCANGKLGAKVLARMGNLTNQFQNPLGNVPTIIFNGVFRKRVSDKSERNFKEQFCLKMESRNLPACQESEVSSPTTPIPYQEKVDVKVYYETLDPYSKRFMVKQLNPFLQGDLSTYINLTLIPYGKAQTFERNISDYGFTCHHGEAECYGNKLQVCAMALFNNGLSTPGLGFNKEAVEFVICLMKDLYATSSITEIDTAFEKCKLTAQYDDIRTCANGKLGREWLARLGNWTNYFQYPLRSVPTIVFNGNFDLQSEYEFKAVFCSKMKSRNHVKACPKVEGFATSTTYIP